jgi:hypothetical protein
VLVLPTPIGAKSGVMHSGSANAHQLPSQLPCSRCRISKQKRVLILEVMRVGADRIFEIGREMRQVS